VNVASLVEAWVARGPDQPAIVSPRATLTRRDLDRRAGGVAVALSRDGVRPGDRVALSIVDGAALAVALLGAWKLGATVAPLNPLLSPEERQRILAHLRPSTTLTEIPAGVADHAAVAAPEAPALVLFTSGSTGVPKGAALSHRATAAALSSWAGPVMALVEADVVLAALPLAHSFGLNGALLAPLIAGASVTSIDRFTPEDALDAVERHGVTVLPAVATMFRRMLDSRRLGAARLDRVRLAVSGAAPCPWDLADEWRRRTGVRILRGYGMTELFRPISYLSDDPTDLPDAIGRAVPGVTVQAVDDEGRPVPPGAVGELLIRSPAAMDGYIDLADETRAVLADGWFRTGDLASVGPDGWVRIAGRKKELILRGGYSVTPGEVEAALCAHEAVAEAAVVGVPHPELGEEVAAFVLLRPGAHASPEALVAHCRARLASFKCPRRIQLVTELPRTATGKVAKSRLIPTDP
jgi:long-chain acyl-CoA synthetase